MSVIHHGDLNMKGRIYPFAFKISPALPDVVSDGRSGNGGAGGFPQHSPDCGPSTCPVEPALAPLQEQRCLWTQQCHLSLLVIKL